MLAAVCILIVLLDLFARDIDGRHERERTYIDNGLDKLEEHANA